MAAQLYSGIKSLHLKLSTPYDSIRTNDVRDDLVGVKVWISTTSGFNPLVGQGTLVFDGLSLSITISDLENDLDYYVKYAFISKIDPDTYTISSELTSKTTADTGAPKFTSAYLYKWDTASSSPTGTSTYTWSTGTNSSYTGNDGWYTSVPSNPGTPLLNLWTATKAVTAPLLEATTTIDWSEGASVSSISQNGAFGLPGTAGTAGVPGINAVTVRVYKTAITIPQGPTGSSTYTWSSASFAAPAGWSLAPPTSSAGLEGQTLWAAVVTITDSAEATTTTINWVTAAIVAQSYYGTKGDKGDTGAQGPAGAAGSAGSTGVSARVAYAVTTGTPSSTPSQKVESGDTVPATGTWFPGVSWQTNSPASLTAGQYLYQVDGLYNPSTNQTTWIGIPYLSALKVGSLSAITANTGALTVTDTITVTGNGTDGVLIKTDGISIFNGGVLRVKLGSI